MIITNSNVSMAASSRYTQASKVTYQETRKPVFNFSGMHDFAGALFTASGCDDSEPLPSTNYSLKDNSKMKAQGDLSLNNNTGTDVFSQIRSKSLEWLLKLLFGEDYSEEDRFASQLQSAFYGGSQMEVTTTKSYEYYESESMSFSTTGCVQTADGRSFDFNLEMSMSREFYTSYTESYRSIQDIRLLDPLVINLKDCESAQVTDQKFFFDLDCDGKEDELSILGENSGFLVYDKNEDGKINDGSEMFGAISGDAFADLAKYDEDHNGWIDEADEIFKKLKVWCLKEDGTSELMDLKSADVGAIFLGRAKTGYSLKDKDNVMNARIAETGVYLRESTGRAGTVQHVDLATA